MLLTLGISHKTAPIEVREKLAFSQENIPNALKTLVNEVALEEVALLSTCNRTELYCSTLHKESTFKTQVINWWQSYNQTSFDVKPYLYTFSNDFAVSHMMRVASGLDSMLLGEPQILGQLKTAFQLANQNGVLGKRLLRLFQTSFSVAKRVRHHTQINAHPVSVAYAAVSLAKQIFSDLSKATVMLIGAGENIELTLQHLKAKNVQKIIIVNRTLAHAKSLTECYGGESIGLDKLPIALAQADIVISAIASPKPVLLQAHLDHAFSRKRRPIFMVDLGVPRNIEPTIADHEDIYLYTVDDLQGIVTENLKNRELAALEAESIIEQATQAYMHWVNASRHRQAVVAIRHQADKLKNETLAQALKRLARGDNPNEVITHFAHQLTQKLMHQPTMNVKDLHHDKIELVKELFDIE
ncbi:MAG: glutamyl-tRNA reductase [Proteobacteria bacterium]|nr:glutamyl-tRNA reductase [Pseudomonadota bacterium]